MSTDLLYLDDTYIFEGTANLKSVGSDERGEYAILDQTIFYPQGGGQPSDTGTISFDGENVGVNFVGFAEGEVRHYGNFSAVGSKEGAAVGLKVDGDKRLRHAKSHTAGHLVCAVGEALAEQLVGIKGYHFLDGSYVEFRGGKPAEVEAFKEQANSRLKELIDGGAGVTAKLVTLEELREQCKSVPDGLPEGKPLRVVQIGDLPPLPCGGTHVKDVSELQEVQVTKMKSKKGNTKVSYSCS